MGLILQHKKLKPSSLLKYIKLNLVYGPEFFDLSGFEKIKLIVAAFEFYCVLGLCL